MDDGINISITKILTLPMSDFSLTSWVKTSDMLGQRCIVSTDGDGISGFRYGYSSSNSAYFLYGGYSEGYI